MQEIPVYVISLVRAQDRRHAISKHLQALGIRYKLIDAVDGREMSSDERSNVTAPGVILHPGAVGCYLSHLKAYEDIVRGQHPVALILEDDARLNPKFSSIIMRGLKNIDFDYCFLDCDDHNLSGPIFYDLDSRYNLDKLHKAFTLSAGPQTTHAYMITQAAAKARLEHAFPIQAAIDIYDHLPYAIHFRAIVSPKAAWVSEHSLVSFTSVRNDPAAIRAFRLLRRSPFFYLVRDFIRLKNFRRNRIMKKLVQEGRLSADRKWRVLPFGREVIVGQ